MDDLKPVTHLLAVNVASRSGLKVLHEGIRYLVQMVISCDYHSILIEFHITFCLYWLHIDGRI